MADKKYKLFFRGVRSSKFRHVYGEPVKRNKCYDDIPITRNAHDSQFCAVNPKFIAIVAEVAGGGAFVVLPIDCTGRLDFNASRVTGHKGPILDIKWNPFNDNVIATCSDDCTIKLWHIPDKGIGVNLSEWLVELVGHKRRVSYIEWHPTAENIIFSASFDHTIIVWDIENGNAVNTITCHPDVIHCMALNRDGSLMATTCKDKKLRIIEPRSGLVKSEIVCHEGSKASKVTFLKDNRALTTGFSRHSDRQYAIWDIIKLKELHRDTIDSSSGVVFPFFDYDTNIIYLAGKGDGTIRYYEIVDQQPHIYFLNQFLSGNPQRGLGFMPKRGLNTNQCEVFRFYKLHTTKGFCEPINMIVPRKSDQFHDDIYPDTSSHKPALTSQQWINGRDAMPILMSMKTGESLPTTKPVVIKTVTPTIEKLPEVPPPIYNNMEMKFAFLSKETVPDYRPKDVIIDKNQKSPNNQMTKFNKMQMFFGNIQNNDENNIDYKNENDLKRAVKRQSEEIRVLKKQLTNSEMRVKELEEQVKRLQSQHN